MAKNKPPKIQECFITIPMSQLKMDSHKERIAKQLVNWLSTVEATSNIPAGSLFHLTFSCDVEFVEGTNRPTSAIVGAPQKFDRPGVRSTVSATAADSEWSCITCKTTNTGKAPTCTLCSAPRPRVGPSEVASLLAKVNIQEEVPPGFPPKPEQVEKFDGDPRTNQEAYKVFMRKKLRWETWRDALVAHRMRTKEGNREAADMIVKNLRQQAETWESDNSRESPLSSSTEKSARSEKRGTYSDSVSSDSKPSSTSKLKSTPEADEERPLDPSDEIALKLLAQFEEMGITSTPSKPTLDFVEEEPEETEETGGDTADEIARQLLAQMGLDPSTPRDPFPRDETSLDQDLLSSPEDEPLPDLKIPLLPQPAQRAVKSTLLPGSRYSHLAKSPRDYGPLLDGQGTVRLKAPKDDRSSFMKSPRGTSFRNYGPLFDGESDEEQDNETGSSSGLDPEDYKETAQRILASLADSLVEDDAEREKQDQLLDVFDSIQAGIENLRVQAEPDQFNPPAVAKIGKEIREQLTELPQVLKGAVDERPYVKATSILLTALLRYIRAIYQQTGDVKDSDEALTKAEDEYIQARDEIQEAIRNTPGEWKRREEQRAAAHTIIEDIALKEKAFNLISQIKERIDSLWTQSTSSAANTSEVVVLAKHIKEHLADLAEITTEDAGPEEIEFAKATQLLTASLLRLSKSKHSNPRENSPRVLTTEESERKVKRVRADYEKMLAAYEAALPNQKSKDRIIAEKVLEEASKADKAEKLKKQNLNSPSKIPMSPKPIRSSAQSSKTSIPSINIELDSAPQKVSSKQLDSVRQTEDSIIKRGRSSSAPQTPRERQEIRSPRDTQQAAVESQVAMLLNAEEASEALDVEIAEANFEDVSSRLNRLEELFGQLGSDSEDEGDYVEKSGKAVSVMDLFGPMSPLPERSAELIDDSAITANGQQGGRQWPPRKINTQYQPKNEARLRRASQELRTKQLRTPHQLKQQRTGSTTIPTPSGSSDALNSPYSSDPQTGNRNSTDLFVTESGIPLPPGFPPPPEVNKELAKFANLSLGDPKATVTRKNREQYKEYMKQRLMYEQWENGLILYTKRLEEGNSEACESIVQRLTEALTDRTETSDSARSSHGGESTPEASVPTDDHPEKKTTKKKKGMKERRRSATKSVKMLSGVSRARAPSSDTEKEKKKEKSEKKFYVAVGTTVGTSSNRDTKETGRHSLDSPSDKEGSRAHRTSHMGDVSASAPTTHDTTEATPDEKRAQYKRTKSSDALRRVSKVFKLET